MSKVLQFTSQHQKTSTSTSGEHRLRFSCINCNSLEFEIIDIDKPEGLLCCLECKEDNGMVKFREDL